MLVDGAQAAGHLAVDLGALGVDAWATSGHKALLGPQGTGVLYLAPGCNPLPLVEGGTGGGLGERDEQPEIRPERYEAGTGNLPGIAGLGAAVRILAERADAIRAEERRLARRLHEGLLEIDGFRVLGPAPSEPRVPLVSAVHARIGADRFAGLLDREYGVAVRSGLHCATWAHESLGTLETGALRFGVGHGNTDEDVDLALGALAEARAQAVVTLEPQQFVVFAFESTHAALDAEDSPQVGWPFGGAYPNACCARGAVRSRDARTPRAGGFCPRGPCGSRARAAGRGENRGLLTGL